MTADLAPDVVRIDHAPGSATGTTVATTTYGSVLVHLDDSERCRIRVDLAVAIARMHGAHLVGLAATGVLTPYAEVESNPCLYKQYATRRREECASAVARFERAAREGGVRTFEGRVVDELPADAIARASRFADLVVIAQTDPADPDLTTTPLFPETVLMHTCRPLVIVPSVDRFETVGTDVLIAWDDSRAAARAVVDALPFLMRARRVRIEQLNQPGDACSGRALAAFLARHGVAAEIHEERTRLPIGDALLSRAADDRCDLLVMGAYGHSRLREVVLGGTTRTVLDSMTVPVLMSRY